MDKLEVYGFSGKMGSGKNYVSEKIFIPKLNHICPKNTLVMALADHFKVDACAKYNVNYDRIFIKKDDESRKMLQLAGTEEGRMKYGEDIWIRTLKTWMRIYAERGIERIIICDVRFPNEIDFIRSLDGKIIRLNAPNRNKNTVMRESGGDPIKFKSILSHASETALDGYTDFDYVIDNDYDDYERVPGEIDKIIENLTFRT